MQPFDYTTLIAVCTDLQQSQLPARLETVYQRDRYTVSLGLRTLSERVWLNLVWHPQAARLHLDDPPPREPDTFTFSQQLASLLKGLALTAIEPVQPWERVLDLQFSYRPGEATQWHLYVEIMGKYSNVLLVNAEAQIVTAAHQVSDRQSRVRPIQTGQPYVTPPSLQGAIPNLNESFVTWNERVSLIPGAIAKMLVQTYRGVSSQLARTLVSAADCNPQTPTTDITPSEWQAIYAQWQAWLNTLATGSFQPGWAASGYTVLGGDCVEPVANIHQLLAAYYGQQLQQQHFQQLHNQLSQKLKQQLSKLRAKATGFTERLQQSDDADQQRSQADLLMANLHAWQPGLTELLLPDFETGQPVKIALNPERTAIQNAQALYKQHQKRKRARRSVEPLLTAVQQDIDYLEHVEASLVELHHDQGPESLAVLQEVATELSQQGYLPAPERRSARSN
ncbi:MAG: NFACT family protein, partial [Cyanobacteria bacterium P01_H01_bin.121]